jgi:hypothetical protein
VLFHTAFKLEGILSVNFWVMVLVVISEIIGRFIYKQIPLTIQGNKLMNPDRYKGSKIFHNLKLLIRDYIVRKILKKIKSSPLSEKSLISEIKKVIQLKTTKLFL